MPRTIKMVENSVKRRMQKRTYKSILRMVKKCKPKLWGTNQHNLQKKATLVAIYKDQYGISYDKLEEEARDWMATKKSLRHNQKVLRKIFRQWAKKHVKLGTLEDWNRVSVANLRKIDNPPHLLADSTDFRKSGKASTSRKDMNWSYKCNSPGRRYMAFSDVTGKPLRVFGGYSPKLYDGHWVDIKKDWMEKRLKGFFR